MAATAKAVMDALSGSVTVDDVETLVEAGALAVGIAALAAAAVVVVVAAGTVALPVEIVAFETAETAAAAGTWPSDDDASSQN